MTKSQKRKLRGILLCAVLFAAVTVLLKVLPTADKIPWWAILLMYLVPYLIVGRGVITKALRNIAHGQIFDENFLMLLATVVAMIIREYPEAVAVMLFYQIGELFESIAVGKSRGSISSLMELKPDTVNLVKDGVITEVAAEDVHEGDIIQVNVGERIPIDGVIIEGNTSLNCAALTGESIPVDASCGDNVTSGGINLSAMIRIKTNCEFSQSTVARILELVEAASEKKSKSEAFITRFARYYTPAVVIGALLLAVIPSLITGQWAKWIHRALIFLVVSCPCALVISVPISFFGGIGAASKQGILIKGSCYLERLSQVKTVALDKTGTLTKGSFKVTSVRAENGYKQEDVLKYAAYCESFSSHPIAVSIVEAYGKEIDNALIENQQERAGKGVIAVIDGKEVLAGNEALMQDMGISHGGERPVGTCVHVAAHGEYIGCIVISDEIKPDSAQAIKQFKASGIRTVMLTGDEKRSAKDVAQTLGIDEYHAKLMPSDKVAVVESLLDDKSAVAFVGDGINDAPVLMRADIGIAMGALGSDAAIEAADVVLMDDKLSKLPYAVNISRKTQRIVYENITFALAVKALVLVLGALGIAGMWLAVFADVGVSVLAIINGMRTLAYDGSK